MQLSIQIYSGSCNAQRALPRPCTGADTIGSWGGSLDAHSLRAAPLKNYPCNSSDLLFWHRLFLITSSGISFSSRRSEGKGPRIADAIILLYLRLLFILIIMFSLPLCICLPIYPCLFATFTLCKFKHYKQPSMQIIHSKSNKMSRSWFGLW